MKKLMALALVVTLAACAHKNCQTEKAQVAAEPAPCACQEVKAEPAPCPCQEVKASPCEKAEPKPCPCQEVKTEVNPCRCAYRPDPCREVCARA